jgi:hypothetical protein
MRKCLILSALLLATGLVASDALPDLRVSTPGGTMHIREVKLMRVEPDGLRVMHSTGMAKVPYEMLPADLQAKYGFNDVAVKEHRAAAAAPQQPAVVAAAPTAVPAPAAPQYARPAPQPQPQEEKKDDEPPAPLTGGIATWTRIILPQYIGGPNSSGGGCSTCRK